MTPPALELVGIHKSFGSVQAVRGADFTLGKGEVHALLGENGAGKSTLMRMAAGLLLPDRGEVAVNGERAVLRNPRDARKAGIGMVHQHFTSVPAFSVQDNIALGTDWPLAPAELSRRVRGLNTELGFTLDPFERAENLPVAALQRLEILKLMASDASILILDEPTGTLSPLEAEELLVLVRRLVDRGSSAVLITHKLDEARQFADQVTVLRRGKVTLAGSMVGRSASELAQAMLGEVLSEPLPRIAVLPGEPLITAAEIKVLPLTGKGPGVRNGSFQVHAGEMVGVAAVEGNGERELLRVVAGLARVTAGKLSVQGPVSFIPEDRTTEGLIGEFTAAENLTLGLGAAASWIHRGLIDHASARTETLRILQQYEVAAAGPETRAGTLSGGNQQKLILARALERRPRVLVCENPGRGLDVRAVRLSFEWLRAAARGGAGVLLYSSDLDELMEWCDRILVVAEGEVHSAPANASRRSIGHLMLAVAG